VNQKGRLVRFARHFQPQQSTRLKSLLGKKPDSLEANVLNPSHPEYLFFRYGLGKAKRLPGGLAN
jgi:hypothetical protein